MSVTDILDIGGGEPLCAKWEFEDWALFQLRYELYLLQQAFAKDVNDPDRIGINESNFVFYYQKYFNKQINPKNFGHSTNIGSPK